MNLICLDIEATDKGEMLELSIIRFLDKEEIYHSYYKPLHSKTWSNKIHHITPIMVKDAPTFNHERKIVQRILDESDGIIGFALHNDLKYLQKNGINISEEKTIIEVQNWFWYYKGKELGIELGSVPKLSKCAEIYGLNFSEESEAHSATNDTLITLSILDKIIQHNSIEKIDEEHIQEFNNAFELEKEKNAKNKAKGILVLEDVKNGYLLKNYTINNDIENDYLIYVDSRYIAEHEIREKFKSREILPNTGIYKLRNSDIIFFKNYQNTYDSTKEEFYRHIYNAKKSRKSNLNFSIK